MQENNNENKKTLNENDANNVMHNSENTETNDTEETDVTPVSEENISESELTENNESDVPNTISEEEIADNYSFDDEEDDFAISPEENDETAPSEQDDNADDDTETDIKKEQRKAELTKKIKAGLKKAAVPALIAVIVLICTFIAFFIYSLSTIEEDKVMKNVYIEQLDVGGLTYDEALDSINATYLLQNTAITLTSNGQIYEINGSDIGLTAIAEDTAKKAFDYCKSDSTFKNALAAIELMFKPHIIVPAVQVDTEQLDAKLNEFGNIALGERKQHYVEFNDDGTLTIYSGQTGYNLDPSTAEQEVITALDNEIFNNIAVTFTSAPPDEMTVESLDALVYKDPTDARYEVNGNDVNIVAGDTGRYINKDEAAAIIGNVYEGCEPVKLPFYVSYPTVDENTLREKLFSATLSSYSTSYGGSTTNRCANVARAASLINGKVLAPGDVFSFNDTVGHRTIENGFSTAKEYVDGKSVDGIGGGTCQVSSTLYSAVLYADLSIVERLNHMMTVGYIPLGQDATVSDGGVDFKFKNNTDYPIKVSAYTSGATITVSIIGTDWEPHREVKISSTSSTSGKNTVVHSTRYVYVNGELISTDTLNTSTYMPHEP